MDFDDMIELRHDLAKEPRYVGRVEMDEAPGPEGLQQGLDEAGKSRTFPINAAILVKKAAIVVKRYHIARLQPDTAAIILCHDVQRNLRFFIGQTDIYGIAAADMKFKSFLSHELEKRLQCTGRQIKFLMLKVLAAMEGIEIGPLRYPLCQALFIAPGLHHQAPDAL